METGKESVDWIYVAYAWDRWQSLADSVVNVQLLIKGRNFFSSRAAVSF